MIVHGNPGSPFVRKVLVALEEKGMAYEHRDLIPTQKTPEFLAMHPLGKIPVLEREAGKFVPDSSVICLYLERLRPAPSLYPADAGQYAEALFLEEYLDTKAMEAFGAVFFERWVKPILQQKTDETRVEAALKNDVPPVLDYLETYVPSGGGALFERFGIADIALGAHLGSLELAGVAIDAARWPRLAAFAERAWARPSFRRANPA